MGGTTGAAVIIKQNGIKKTMVKQMKVGQLIFCVIFLFKDIFQRDWDSEYAHNLEDYYNNCILEKSADFCEGEKDPSLFAKPSIDF